MEQSKHVNFRYVDSDNETDNDCNSKCDCEDEGLNQVDRETDHKECTDLINKNEGLEELPLDSNFLMEEEVCSHTEETDLLEPMQEVLSNNPADFITLEKVDGSQNEKDPVITNENQNECGLIIPKVEIEIKVSEVEKMRNKLIIQVIQQTVPKTSSSNQTFNSVSSMNPSILERALIKKIVKTDSVKVKYMKLKLRMERDYHKRKLCLMKDLLKVKQRKVKAEERQATALIRIARSLDRMFQNRQQ